MEFACGFQCLAHSFETGGDDGTVAGHRFRRAAHGVVRNAGDADQGSSCIGRTYHGGRGESSPVHHQGADMSVRTLQEFLASSKEKDVGSDAFELESAHMLEVRL